MEIPGKEYHEIIKKHIDEMRGFASFDMFKSEDREQAGFREKYLKQQMQYSLAKLIVESDNVELETEVNAGPMCDKWELSGKIFIIKRNHLKDFITDILIRR